MKQNKNSSVIRFLSFVTALVVLVFSISVPSSAYTDTSSNGIDFSDQPLPFNSSITNNTSTDKALVISDGMELYTQSNGYIIHALSHDDNVFSFSVSSSVYYVSTTRYSWVKAVSVRGTDQIASILTIDKSDKYSTYNLYYVSTSAAISSSNIPSFSSLDVGLSAVKDWIENPPSPVPSPHSFSGSLPAGNAIILDVSGNNAQALSLSTSSALRHKDYWSDGNQMMGYFATAPTSLNSPFEGTHSITWRGTGSPNLFGGFNNWNTTAPLLPTGNFLVIVNPAYPNDNPDSITSNQASNGSISITCGYVRSATVVPLSSSWDNGSIVSSSGNIRLDGEYDSDTDSWSFVNSSTGQPQNPVSGGLTDVDAEHITINDWLQNISHQIGSFFSGAIGAVSTLVSAGSDFIHSLSGLYAWLPAPVYSVLVSALILVITIGVIKVFI